MSSSSQTPEDIYFFQHMDSLAARILDLIILWPVMRLFQSPFRKQLDEDLFFNQNWGVWFFVFISSFIFIFLFECYHFFFIEKKQPTLGQRFFSKQRSVHSFPWDKTLPPPRGGFVEKLFFGLVFFYALFFFAGGPCKFLFLDLFLKGGG